MQPDALRGVPPSPPRPSRTASQHPSDLVSTTYSTLPLPWSSEISHRQLRSGWRSQVDACRRSAPPSERASALPWTPITVAGRYANAPSASRRTRTIPRAFALRLRSCFRSITTRANLRHRFALRCLRLAPSRREVQHVARSQSSLSPASGRRPALRSRWPERPRRPRASTRTAGGQTAGQRSTRASSTATPFHPVRESDRLVPVDAALQGTDSSDRSDHHRPPAGAEATGGERDDEAR